jgi:hypothetical protein
LKLRIEHLEDPVLEFGEGEAVTPKEGLRTGGPFSLRLGAAHQRDVRLGLVGTEASVAATRGFFTRARTGMNSGSNNKMLFPDFPGFSQVFRSELVIDDRLNAIVDAHELSAALAKPPLEAFEGALELWRAAISTVTSRDFRPHVVVCCLPDEVLVRCRMVDTKLTTEQKRAIKRRKQELASGQTSLLELDPNNWLAEEIEADAEQLTRRNFRRALKAASMASNMPIQIATEQLWNDERRNQDEATRAWNVSVALFYKAGGIPWRMRTRVEGTCFVGISFHHRRTTQRHFVYSSLAQAFSSEGDGFAIRGDAVPWDGERVQPRLSEDQAHYLLSKVLTAYRERAGRDPLRVVVHKTSNFTPDERAGIDQALNSVPVIELLTLRPGEFRMLREGVYPPHRGTYCAINDAAFLFTSGYMPAYRTYPGPHVPAPLELVADPGVDTEAAADDVLALTKMNWNSASAFMSLPITLSFAQKVGAVMAEIPPDIDPHPSLRFYI